VFTDNGSQSIATSLSWNAAIPPGGVISSPGFCANRGTPGLLPQVLSASATF
jgi:hypothetical protein